MSSSQKESAILSMLDLPRSGDITNIYKPEDACQKTSNYEVCNVEDEPEPRPKPAEDIFSKVASKKGTSSRPKDQFDRVSRVLNTDGFKQMFHKDKMGQYLNERVASQASHLGKRELSDESTRIEESCAGSSSQAFLEDSQFAGKNFGSYSLQREVPAKLSL